MCFASVEALADGKIIARATGVFHIVPRVHSSQEGSQHE
jgi:hypothetical protein